MPYCVILDWKRFDFGIEVECTGIIRTQVLKRSLVVEKERLNLSVIGIIGAIHTQVLKRPLVIEKERINFD